MARQTNDLFTLIRSLSGSEKRHFKLQASLYKGEKGYLRLFDAIAAQEKYDEEAIQEKFAGEKFTRQLHVAMNYLRRLIMKSLVAYHAESDIGSRIDRYLRMTELLHGRGLFDQARGSLRKARTLAEQGHRPIDLLRVLHFERLLAAEDLFRSISDEEIEMQREEAARLTGEIDMAWRYATLYSRLAKRLVREGAPRGSDRQTLIDDARRALIDADGGSLPIDARVLQLRARVMLHLALGDTDGAIRFSRTMIDLLDAHPEYREGNMGIYVASVNNYLAASLLHGDDGDFLDRLARLRALDPPQERNRIRIVEQSYSLEMWHYIGGGEFARAEKLIGEIEEQLRRHPGIGAKTRLLFTYQFAYVRFALGEYDGVLALLHAIESAPPTGVRNDLGFSAKILALLTHYELGNHELLDYLLRSLYRHLARRDRLHRFEALLLRHVRRMGRIADPADLPAYLHELRADLLPLLDDPGERGAFGYFDIIAWLDAHIEGVPFAVAAARRSEMAKSRGAG
jgi:hypothetical protein